MSEKTSHNKLERSSGAAFSHLMKTAQHWWGQEEIQEEELPAQEGEKDTLISEQGISGSEQPPLETELDILLRELHSMGVNITLPEIQRATKDQLKDLQLLLQKFQDQQPDNHKGKFNLDKINNGTNLVYYSDPRRRSNSSYLYIWLTPEVNKIHISISYCNERGIKIYSDKIIYDKRTKKFNNVKDGAVTPEKTEQSNENAVVISGEVSGAITETNLTVTEPKNDVNSIDHSSSKETDAAGKTDRENENDAVISGDLSEEITEETPITTESENDVTTIGNVESGEADVTENPSDILYEKGASGKWNNTGYSFFRRDGKPLTSKEVYAFIREQKKQGNQDFTEDFKPHIKGKDTEGTYPTFEIKNSKHRYYGYSFDPEWGKKKETAKEPEITEGDKKYIGREVHETAFVKVRTADREKFTGIRLHDFPSPEGKNTKGKGAKIYEAGTPLTILAHGNANAPGWILVQTPDGQTGWIASNWTQEAKTGDNTRYTLRYVNKGETITDLLREIKDVDRDIGYDNKLFANALWLLNKDNPDVYINQSKYKQSITANAAKNAVDPWDAEKRAILQSIEVKQGAQVKIPTKQTIDLMIASGQIEVRPDWVTAGIKTARIIEGLLTGIPIGMYEQAKDTVTGLWDMIKSIFTGEILDQLAELYNALWSMGWDDVKKLLWGLIGVDPDQFEKIWNSKDIKTVDRYKYIGEIIGRLIFEILIAIFTGGAALAKYSTKIPALAKISKSLQKAKNIIPENVVKKLKKTEKATDKVNEAAIPVPASKKKDWLEHHEKDPNIKGKQKHGHTIDRHVGKTDEELIQRLKNEFDTKGRKKMISASSSYKNIDIAQEVISEAIKSNRNKLNNWLKSADMDNLVLEFQGNKTIGRGITKKDYLNLIDQKKIPSSQDLKNLTNAKIILKKNPNGDGYFILTSYPY